MYFFYDFDCRRKAPMNGTTNREHRVISGVACGEENQKYCSFYWAKDVEQVKYKINSGKEGVIKITK